MIEPNSDLLLQFLECVDGAESENLLERIMREQVTPIIGPIVSSRIRDTLAEDIRGDILADLIARLRHLKKSAEVNAIRDFPSYTAIAAYHACDKHYRRALPHRRTMDKREAHFDIASESASVETKLVQRGYLKRLWTEIANLPRPQRISLLLSLRDDRGNAAITLLPVTRVADLSQIASALDMEAEELAEMWTSLPLDDLTIAARLGLNRQRVIDLRRKARGQLIKID